LKASITAINGIVTTKYNSFATAYAPSLGIQDTFDAKNTRVENIKSCQDINRTNSKVAHFKNFIIQSLEGNSNIEANEIRLSNKINVAANVKYDEIKVDR
jgi:hypothetical protein